MTRLFWVFAGFAALVPLGGCAGFIIGNVVDATIEVAKIPFKVAKAVVDVATGDDDNKKNTSK